MPLGGINHVALTVSDLARSEAAFHAPVLGFLGFEKAEEAPGFALWFNAKVRLALALHQASEAGGHDRGRPGLHHLAFEAPDRSEVDEFHALLTERGITVLDAPAEYPDHGLGYYAVHFADPDGVRYELAHMPVIPD